MKKFLIILFSVVLTGYLSGQTPNYQLVFSEDFDSTSLNLNKWNISTGYAPNQEKQYYTDGNNNIRVENGQLIITGKKENAVTDRNYTSGKITSKGKGFIKYGKVEARISVPAGRGTWPAFWMMPEFNTYGTWPRSGEIDIMEHIGSDPRMTSHAVHTYYKNGSLGNNWFNRQYKDSMENQFHVYALEWDADMMKFYIDGVKSTSLYRNFTEDYRGWPFDHEFYVILNLAIGGTMGGTIDDAIFNNPVELKVDYVRMYQLVSANTEMEMTAKPFVSNLFKDVIQFTNDKPMQVKLFSANGLCIFDETVEPNGSIRTSSFPSGIYLLNTEENTYKMIK